MPIEFSPDIRTKFFILGRGRELCQIVPREIVPCLIRVLTVVLTALLWGGYIDA
jgi:hypothetical protein